MAIIGNIPYFQTSPSGNAIIKHQTQVVESFRELTAVLVLLSLTWPSSCSPCTRRNIFLSIWWDSSFLRWTWQKGGKMILQKLQDSSETLFFARNVSYTPVQQVCNNLFSPGVLECQQLVHRWLIAIKPDSILAPGCTRSAEIIWKQIPSGELT